MTELETMQRAKRYIDKLAQGIDPVTDQELTGDTVLNQARLVRCFFYVSDVLQRVIDNGGAVGNERKIYEFTLSPEQIAAFPYEKKTVRISEFVEMLYRAAQNPQMKKPKTTWITNWLLAKGFLMQEARFDGKLRRVPTKAGQSIGMSRISLPGKYGEYDSVYYDLNAQHFILDNLDSILAEK